MKVTILSGASGSGKSTWARKEEEEPGTVVFSADYFFEREGDYNFDPSLLGEAHGDCLRQFTEELRNGLVDHLIVDNTNTSVMEVAPYYQLALAYGADVKVLQFTGQYDNVHGVPEGAVKRMRERAAKLVRYAPPWWQFEVAGS